MIQKSMTRAINIMKKYKIPLEIFIVHQEDINHHAYYDLEALSCDFNTGVGVSISNNDNPDNNSKYEGEISASRMLDKIDTTKLKYNELRKKISKKLIKGKKKYSKKKVKALLTCQRDISKLVKNI